MIIRMIEAYEHALLTLRITDRSGPLAESIAMKIIEIAPTDERKPVFISARAIRELGISIPE